MDELQLKQLEEQGYFMFKGLLSRLDEFTIFNSAAAFVSCPENRCQRPLLRLDDR